MSVMKERCGISWNAVSRYAAVVTTGVVLPSRKSRGSLSMTILFGILVYEPCLANPCNIDGVQTVLFWTSALKNNVFRIIGGLKRFPGETPLVSCYI